MGCRWARNGRPHPVPVPCASSTTPEPSEQGNERGGADSRPRGTLPGVASVPFLGTDVLRQHRVPEAEPHDRADETSACALEEHRPGRANPRAGRGQSGRRVGGRGGGRGGVRGGPVPPECCGSPMRGYPRRGPRRSSPERSMPSSRLVRSLSAVLVLVAVSARGVVAGPPVVWARRA